MYVIGSEIEDSIYDSQKDITTTTVIHYTTKGDIKRDYKLVQEEGKWKSIAGKIPCFWKVVIKWRKVMKPINILAIETSCDETAAAVIQDGRKIISNVVATQIDLHKKYGGVVPEIASRMHVEKINLVINEALKTANLALDDIDVVGVTYGPGLVGALLVGVVAAKAIAFAKNIAI